MDFDKRIKKELTEGVVRAILVDAGYRVLDFGIENQVRELECLTALEYLGLDFPKAIRAMPDMVVMDRNHTEKFLVEVKYRRGWTNQIWEDIREQVEIFKEVVLVYLNSAPELPDGREPSPGTYLRCCRLYCNDGAYQAEVRYHDEVCWMAVDELGQHTGQW